MKKIIVVPRHAFEAAVKSLGAGWVYVSIENIGESHLLPDGPGVLNIDFDDVSEGPGVITPEQAEEIYRFATDHTDYNILIHCTAGKSRSQGVARALWDCFPDVWVESLENRINPCVTPNITVCAQIKRVHYKYMWNDIEQ